MDLNTIQQACLLIDELLGYFTIYDQAWPTCYHCGASEHPVKSGPSAYDHEHDCAIVQAQAFLAAHDDKDHTSV